MKKHLIECTALFPHNNVFFNLEKEQKELERLYTKLQKNNDSLEPSMHHLPFRLMLPVCPVTKEKKINRFTIKALEAHQGFIIRPIWHSGLDTVSFLELRLNPYPKFPHVLGFILGYAGKHAKKVIHSYTTKHKDFISGKELRVWYFAQIQIEYGIPENGTWYSSWKCGQARWQKA